MATVFLHGELKQFGEQFDLVVDNAGEAVRALCCQLDGFQKAIADGHFFVKVAEKNVAESELETAFNQHLSNDDVIHIVPVIAGAGKMGQIVLGAVMIVAAFYTGGLSLGALSISGSTLAMAGVGLVLGGVSQMLMKTPDMGSASSVESAKSSSFSSLANATAQGSCVPVAYGEMMIGSKVISQSVESYKVTGDETDTDAKQLAITKSYFTPVAQDGFTIDADDDSVIAANYKAVVA